jgi:hypothetical protein
VSTETANLLELAISFLATACSVCLYVPAVLYRAWVACWAFGLTLLIFGVIDMVMLARVGPAGAA